MRVVHVIHGGRLSDDFEISSGVRQGCLLSLLLLLLVVLDWATRTAYSSSKKGIQWTLMTKLEDLEFADDLALLSHRLQDMQDKVTALETTAQRVGLKISQEKTKLLRTNNQQEAPVTISGKAVEDVSQFVYLGSKMSQTGGTDKDIKARVKKARQAFAILKPVWRATTICTNTTLRIFNSNVKSTREEEERAPQAYLEEELALRAARLRSDMGGGQDLRHGQNSSLELSAKRKTAGKRKREDVDGKSLTDRQG
nr:hypothetical protein BaRGS_022544 [Batillaria attramentaria]